MRVLVTGSEGFVGKNLIPYLEEKHIEVVTLDKKPSSRFGHIEYCLGDESEYATSRLPDVDWVVHVASTRFGDNILRENIIGTRELFHRYRTTKTILLSDAEVSRAPLEEKFQYDCESEYAATKASQELLAQSFVESQGSEIVILRTVSMFGPHQRLDALVPQTVRDALNNKEVYGVNYKIRQWTPVKHVCDCINFLIASNFVPPKTILHAVGTAAMYDVSMIRSIMSMLGANKKIVSVAGKFRPSHLVRTKETDDFCLPEYNPENFDKDLEETVKFYADQFRGNGGI